MTLITATARKVRGRERATFALLLSAVCFLVRMGVYPLLCNLSRGNQATVLNTWVSQRERDCSSFQHDVPSSTDMVSLGALTWERMKPGYETHAIDHGGKEEEAQAATLLEGKR